MFSSLIITLSNNHHTSDDLWMLWWSNKFLLVPGGFEPMTLEGKQFILPELHQADFHLKSVIYFFITQPLIFWSYLLMIYECCNLSPLQMLQNSFVLSALNAILLLSSLRQFMKNNAVAGMSTFLNKNRKLRLAYPQTTDSRW